jgi:hypothetical protein
MKSAQHVPVQGAQGCDVNGLRALPLSRKDFVKDGQGGSFGLAGPGRRDEEHILSGQDGGNRLLLRQRRLKDGLICEHCPDLGMKLTKNVHKQLSSERTYEKLALKTMGIPVNDGD